MHNELSTSHSLAPQAAAMTVGSLIEREREVVANNYLPVPVVIDRARGIWVWDLDGKRYLDFMSAYSAVSHGHLHPRLVAAAQAQLSKVAVTSRAYHSTTLAPFIEKLTALAGLDKALPMNTGAEAVETAIKAARRWGYRVKGIAPDQAKILVARENFHGRTTSIISFSSDVEYRRDFGPFTPGFVHFDFGDIASLDAAYTPDCCAVLVEPIQGEAGIIVPPPGYLRALRQWCDQHKVLLILDEVQSGLGRTGRMFAFEHEGIKPDGLILGKALGGGLLPVSAFVASNELMAMFNPGSHGSTFGGNALAAAVGLEALQVLQDEQLVQRSDILGRHLLAALSGLASSLISDVRGRGLWVGVQIDPHRASARKIVERLAQRGVLSKETHETVIRFAPPLIISRSAIDWGVRQFAATLAEFEPSHRASSLRRDNGRASENGSTAATAPSAGTTPQLLMSPPDFFEVSYSINPWMNPQQWSQDADRLAHDANAGWRKLRAAYESLGARIHLQPPARDLPDLVFTANCAVALDRKVLMANFRPLERQGEHEPGRRAMQLLQQQGLLDSIHTMPAGVYFEGAGDAIWDASRSMFWLGYGQRSSFEARDTITAVFGQTALSLRLIDPRFYHLDTCFCPLSGGEILYYPPAFDDDSIKLIEAVAGDRLLVASDADATHLGVNSVCIGNDMVMGHCSEQLRSQLQQRGYRVHLVDLGSFNRSGGSAYCLTLRLDRLSTAFSQSPRRRGESDRPPVQGY